MADHPDLNDYSALDALPDTTSGTSTPAASLTGTPVADYSALDALPHGPSIAQPATPTPQSAPVPGYLQDVADRSDDIRENLFKDVGEFTRGAGSMWTLLNRRALEAALYGAQRSLEQNPVMQQQSMAAADALRKAGAGPLFRKSDIPQLAGLAQQTAQQVYRDYINPAFQSGTAGLQQQLGMPKSDVPPDWLWQRFKRTPLSTTLDTLPVSVPAIKGVASLFRKLPRMPLGGSALGIVSKEQKAQDLVEEAHNQYLRNIQSDKHAMERAMIPVSAIDRKLASVLHEATDPTLAEHFKLTPEMWSEYQQRIARAKNTLNAYFDAKGRPQKFVSQADINAVKKEIEELQEFIDRRMNIQALRTEASRQAEMQREAFHITAREHQVRVALPRYLAEQAAQGRIISAEEALASAEDVRAIRRLYGELQRNDEGVGYVPLVARGEYAKTAVRSFNTFFGSGYQRGAGMPKWMEPLAKFFAHGKLKTLEEVPQEQRPVYLRSLRSARIGALKFANRELRTVRENMHELDIGRAVLERSMRARRFEALEGLVKKLTAMAPTEDTPGWERINMQAELESAFPGVKNVEKGQISTGSDQEIRVPTRVAKLLRQSIHGESAPDIIERLNSIYKTALFTLDFSFGSVLFAQTGVILGATIKTPKDLARMMAAAVIAANPNAEELLPNEMLLSHGGQSTDIRLIEAGINWSDLKLQGIKDVPRAAGAGAHEVSRLWAHAKELKGRADYGPHNWQRRTLAVKRLMETMADAPKDMQGFIADALNSDAALERMAKGVAKAEDVRDLQHFIRGYLGDYSTLARMKRRGLGRFFPLIAWVDHARQMALRLPASNPYKTAFTRLTGHLIADGYDADEHGRVPVRDADGNLLRGPNGGVMYYQGRHLDLYEAGAELLVDAAEFAFNEGHKYKIASAIAPAMQIAGSFFSDTDPSTGIPWSKENPEVIEVWVKGKLKYYNKVTHKVMDRASPHPLITAGHIMFRKQFDAMQRAVMGAESGKTGQPLKQPSPFTYPGHPAAKQKAGRDLLASPIESTLAGIGEQAFEADIPANKLASKRAHAEAKRVQRMLDRQFGRSLHPRDKL